MTPKSRKEASRQAYDYVKSNMPQYRGWSQCAVLALQDTFDMKDDNVLKASSGMVGGIGRLEDVCGAVLGASMMLGMKYGRGYEDLDDEKKLMNSAIPVGKLYKWVEKEFGSVKCHDILTRFGDGVYYDRKVDWQAELANEAGIREKCQELTAKTAARAAEMIWDGIEEEKK